MFDFDNNYSETPTRFRVLHAATSIARTGYKPYGELIVCDDSDIARIHATMNNDIMVKRIEEADIGSVSYKFKQFLNKLFSVASNFI